MDTRDRVLELDGRLRGGDFAALRDFLAPVFYGAEPRADEPAASDRIADLALEIRAAMPDLTASLDDVEAGDDGLVTATLTLHGTHTAELWGVPAHGEVFEWVVPVTIRAVDDKLAFTFGDLPQPERVAPLRSLRMVNPPDEMDQPPHFPQRMPDFVYKLAFTGEAGDRPCSHLDLIAVTEPPTAVCAQCEESGDIWPALRMCLVCGYVGCCDTSKNRHMADHYAETGHPIFRSIRDDEGWIWCYEDDAFFDSSVLDRYR
jgi:hypothetical protein